MIVIVGATGVLGREVTRRLLAVGTPVRAVTRAPESARDLGQLGAEVVQADLTDAPSLARACAGADAVLASAHALTGRGKYSSHAVDDVGHRALIDAARAAGVERFVYTSTRSAAADHPVDFFRTKAAIERHLRDSGLDYVILRPSPFMEWHVHRLLGKGIVERGKTIVMGPGTMPTNFIAATDLAQYAVAALIEPRLSRRILELGGPDNVTRRDIVTMYEQHARRSAKVTYVPLGLMRAMAPLVQHFNPVVGRLMDVGVWGETTDQAFDVRALPQDIHVPLTPVETFIAEQVRGAAAQPA